MRRLLLVAIWAALLGLSSCTTLRHQRRQWSGEVRENGITALSLGFDRVEDGPFLELELPSDWASRPRTRLGEDRWTLNGLEELKPQVAELRDGSEPRAAASTAWKDGTVAVVETSAPNASADAHRARARGQQVFQVELEQSGNLTHLVVFGGIDWPLEWVRLARFQWEAVPVSHGEWQEGLKVMAMGLKTFTVFYGLANPDAFWNPEAAQ